MDQENKKQKLNSYTLTRQWFDFAFDNPDKVSPVHTALYLWLCELNNRMGWSEKFGAPAGMSMAAIGIKHHTTYKKAFDELLEWGFVRVIEKSKNQYTANVISLNAMSKNSGAHIGAHSEALDRAISGAHSEAHAVYINIKTDQTDQTPKLENNGEPVNASEIILYLNEKSGKQFKLTGRKTNDLILARENEGCKLADFIKVIDNKVADWKDDPAMDKYLRPETLFSNKFEGYLNEKRIPNKKRQLSFQQDLEDVNYNQKA